jgi:hypothetical protein
LLADAVDGTDASNHTGLGQCSGMTPEPRAVPGGFSRGRDADRVGVRDLHLLCRSGQAEPRR